MPAVIRSEGQRLLRLLAEPDGRLGKAVGVSRLAVNKWRSGKSQPTINLRRALEELYGVPHDAWTQLPQSTEAVHRGPDGRVTTAQGRPPPPRLQAVPDEAASEIDSANLPRYGTKHSAPLPSTKQGVEELLRSLRAARTQPHLLATDRVKLATAETRALSLLQKMEKEAEFSEDRIIRQHPKWAKLRQAIVDALVPYPDAARAVQRALESLVEKERASA